MISAIIIIFVAPLHSTSELLKNLHSRKDEDCRRVETRPESISLELTEHLSLANMKGRQDVFNSVGDPDWTKALGQNNECCNYLHLLSVNIISRSPSIAVHRHYGAIFSPFRNGSHNEPDDSGKLIIIAERCQWSVRSWIWINNNNKKKPNH